jgi:hypothetical protein
VGNRQCAVAVRTSLTKRLDHKKHERRILDPRPGEGGKTAGLFDDLQNRFHGASSSCSIPEGKPNVSPARSDAFRYSEAANN